MINEADWAPLETVAPGAGVAYRRLAGGSAGPLFLGVRHPDHQRRLVYRYAVGAHQPDLPQCKGVRTSVEHGAEGLEVVLALTAMVHADVFNALAGDIATAVHDASSDDEGLALLLDRLLRWQRLLDAVPQDGLDANYRRGLYGELLILEQIVSPAVGPAAAVSAWTGPARAHQDFQLPNGAVEVKTTAGKRPQRLTITNERELDASHLQVLLLAFVILDERLGGTGESLNERVDRVRALSFPAGNLDARLTEYGYLGEHHDLYDEPRYSVRGSEFWHVTEGFPCIVEADLPPGVGDVRYQLSVEALQPFVVDAHEAVVALQGSQT